MFKKLIALLLTSMAVLSAQAGCCGGCCGRSCRPRVARIVRNNVKKPVVQQAAPNVKRAPARRICRGGCCSCCR